MLEAGLHHALGELVETRLSAGIGILFGGIDIHDEVQLRGQVVEHHQFLGQHQQDVRGAEMIGIGVVGQSRLDVADAVVAEIADQTAVESRQTVQLGDAEAGHILLDPAQRIFRFNLLEDFVVAFQRHLTALHPNATAATEADDGVAAPFLAALHRFEQVTVGLVGELEIDAERGFEVGEQLAREGDAVTGGRELFELFQFHEDSPGR